MRTGAANVDGPLRPDISTTKIRISVQINQYKN